jgi:hypothetical protein
MHMQSYRWAMAVIAFGCALLSATAQTASWSQWGQNPQHTGNMPVTGQLPQARLSDTIFDPFVSQEVAESGGLLTHHQGSIGDQLNGVYGVQVRKLCALHAGWIGTAFSLRARRVEHGSLE